MLPSRKCLLFIFISMKFYIILSRNDNSKAESETNYRNIDKQNDSHHHQVLNEEGVLSEEDGQEKDEFGKQEQKAICTIVMGNVRASAEAYHSSKQKDRGQTAPDSLSAITQFYLALENLEGKFMKGITKIQMLLESLEGQLSGRTNTKHMKCCPCDGENIDRTNTEQTTISSDLMAHIKDSSKDNNDMKATDKFRHTQDNYMNVFRYSWKMENFSEHSNHIQSQHSVESPIFSIRDKQFQIRVIFHHLNRDYVYLQLIENNQTQNLPMKTLPIYLMDVEDDAENSKDNIHFTKIIENQNVSHHGNPSNEENDKDRILLNMNMIFKHIDDEHRFLFKHKIAILDQDNRSFDLLSQTFHNLQMGFSVPNSALRSNAYVKDDALIIQIIAFL